jgi:arylsulfatase A-like enzyme
VIIIKNGQTNILLISIDCARADHLSIYGYDRKTTPYIDKLSKESVVYENAISPGGWTLPSHASMFTGTYPSKHGCHDKNHFLENELPTIAEVLNKLGYKTVGFCRNDYVSSSTGLNRGFEEYYTFHYKIRKYIKRGMHLLSRKMDKI